MTNPGSESEAYDGNITIPLYHLPAINYALIVYDTHEGEKPVEFPHEHVMDRLQGNYNGVGRRWKTGGSIQDVERTDVETFAMPADITNMIQVLNWAAQEAADAGASSFVGPLEEAAAYLERNYTNGE